jgi:hypothetical protein
MSAWCIHIADRKDREEYIKDLRKSFHINVFEAERSSDGKKGCYESHQRIMQQCKDDPYAIIFEDDAVAVDLKYFDEALNFAKRSDWDIIYLGCFPDIFRFQENVIGHILKVKVAMTHAYIVSSSYMKKFSLRPYDGIPVDNVFRDEARTFAILPSMFTQANTESDVANVFSSVFVKDFVVAFCEFYAREVGVPVHVLGLLVAFLIIINGRSAR